MKLMSGFSLSHFVCNQPRLRSVPRRYIRPCLKQFEDPTEPYAFSPQFQNISSNCNFNPEWALEPNLYAYCITAIYSSHLRERERAGSCIAIRWASEVVPSMGYVTWFCSSFRSKFLPVTLGSFKSVDRARWSIRLKDLLLLWSKLSNAKAFSYIPRWT